MKQKVVRKIETNYNVKKIWWYVTKTTTLKKNRKLFDDELSSWNEPRQ